MFVQHVQRVQCTDSVTPTLTLGFYVLKQRWRIWGLRNEYAGNATASRLPARQTNPRPTKYSMSARSNSQSTPDQQPGSSHGAKQDESTIARCSPTILCDVRPRATNLVPTPPNKQPKSSWIWRHGEAVTDLKDDLSLSLIHI